MISQDRVLAEIQSLPTLSATLTRLSAVLADDTAGAADVAAALKPDPALTANVLRMANSPFFGCAREVTAVRQAVTVLGVKRLYEVAVAGAFSRVLPSRLPGYQLDAADFWRHSAAVGVISEHLARRAKTPTPEMVFTAGLLHDVGKLAVGAFIAEAPAEVLSRLDGCKTSFVEAERHALGTDHTEVGALLIERWCLPETIGAAARWHHDPAAVKDPSLGALVGLVHVADVLAHLLGYGADVGELSRRTVETTVELLGLSPTDLELVACETADAIDALVATVG